MENGRWNLRVICLAFFFVTSFSSEFLIQQVTEYNSSYNPKANLEVTRELRTERPSSKIVTIGNFSVVMERSEPYESSVFEASGYKWIEDTESLPTGWEVDVDLKLFVFNARQRKYLTITDQAAKRYNQENREWGFGQLIPLSTFRNPNQGFIVQNTVSFGAEIFVIKPVEQQERVRILSNPPDNVFSWRILHFSSLEDRIYYSSEFLVGDRFWRLGFNPKGEGEGRPHAIPIFLYAQGFKPNAVETSTWGAVNLRLRHQLGSNPKRASSAAWYPIQPGHREGVSNIILRKDLQDGYLVRDSIVFEAEMVRVSVTNIVPV
ncbi:uncharacterized protein LOC108826531 isoform X3 [Raphanus sativus]|uniref:Uncharacterized protein LOC108826531 isoform X3 n=1 Tax=Raphanus sativus TaxID=3726 RepID=A0A6J0L5D4_RAPSA|nr:uncharacterized protein LOC108826531 isoform X3 [Raphanus sativus]